jgi:hypothetical protein
MKVLSGETYTLARLCGIMHEMWCTHIGHQVQSGNTIYATGSIVINTLTSAVGMLIDENNQYYSLLPEVHANRLVDVVEGDGWMDNKNNENGGIG